MESIVKRVDQSVTHIEQLLLEVEQGGLGRFEFFLGKSGSGKTTFLKTLPYFFEGINVIEVDKKTPLAGVAEQIRKSLRTNDARTLFVMTDRDNPAVADDEARGFFESLRVLFREPEGQMLVIWPITDEVAAQRLAQIAFTIGRDSLVSVESNGVYQFVGLAKSDYYNVADTTARSLSGQGLESYGITAEQSAPLVHESDTISIFYSRLESQARAINGQYAATLKERIRPRVWVLLCGDEATNLSLTVATLTQGTRKRIDIDRLVDYLDTPALDAAYLKDWKERRSNMAYLMRMLDVRLFEVFPNVTLAAARAYGDEAVRAPLKKQSEAKSAAIEAVRKSQFYRALCEAELGGVAIPKATSSETRNEYIRLQQAASKRDKMLNRALADAIRDALDADGIKATVETEKRGLNGNLQPDILVAFPDGGVVCLEPTWRTTGQGIDGEKEPAQNTLTTGHIQKYLLEKAIEYVKDLGL
ncbi:hypothetical protein AB8V91_27135 [Archangium violaceum]